MRIAFPLLFAIIRHTMSKVTGVIPHLMRDPCLKFLNGSPIKCGMTIFSRQEYTTGLKQFQYTLEYLGVSK